MGCIQFLFALVLFIVKETFGFDYTQFHVETHEYLEGAINMEL